VVGNPRSRGKARNAGASPGVLEGERDEQGNGRAPIELRIRRLADLRSRRDVWARQRPAAFAANAHVRPHLQHHRAGGAHGKGQIVAELKIAGNPALDWVWACHFKGDPVLPGCLGLDALWQLTGFFLGWLGASGKGRALGVGEVKLTGMVMPTTKTVQFVVDFKRVILRRLKLAIADGIIKADGQVVYAVSDLRVGLFEAGEQSATA